MGIYTSSNSGGKWKNSLVPGYPSDTSAEGQDSRLFGSNFAAGDPLLDRDNGHRLFAGGISFNRTDPNESGFIDPTPSHGGTYLPDGQGEIVVAKSTNGGVTWNTPVEVDDQPLGHQWWPNIEYNKKTDKLGLIYYDSRFDPSYSVNCPPGSVDGGTSACGVPASAVCNVLNTFVATSSNGVAWTAVRVSDAGHQPEDEMFGNRDVPFHGDYNWIVVMSTTFYAVWAR
jgi:hypothetical protein